MNEEFLNQHRIIVQMILILFEGSIRYEDLLEIIIKTGYNNVKSPSAASRFFSEFRKGGIFNELTDKDRKKRFRINKPVIAYLKKVDAKKVSSVSVKMETLVRSNFKVRYFIEKYIDHNPNQLTLEKIVANACNHEGNLFNPRDEEVTSRIVKKIGHSSLTDSTITFLKEEEMDMKKKKENQLKNLKLGPEKRKELALLKEQGVDVGEEYNGKPKGKEVKSKKSKKTREKKNSLERLKKNDIYLSEILIEDVAIPINYSSWFEDKYFCDKFDNLNTKKVTLKFVHFCSAVDVKTSRIINLYNLVKDYSNAIKTVNVVEGAMRFIRTTQSDIVKQMSESQLHNSIKTLKFKADHIAQIEVELDVIFINKINYNKAIKRLKTEKELTSQSVNPSYEPRTIYKINFRHYDIYTMNEHTRNE